MSVLNKAIAAFKGKNYIEALNLFEQAGLIYGEKIIEANVRLCKKNLGHPVFNFIENKPDCRWGENSFLSKYFDNIYLVNLKSEVKRRLSSALHLKKNNIRFQLFEATNGYEGEAFETYKKYAARALGDLKRYPDFGPREVKRGKHFIESAGAIGYIYTYLRIISDAKKNNYKKILILEDDIILHNDFFKRFESFVEAVPSDWKILQLGASQYNWDSVCEESSLKNGYYFPRRLDTCGSFAIAIEQSVFDEIIEAESAFESPFDHLAMGEIYERHLGKCFVCYPNIVMPDVASSSIRGGRSQEAHSQKMRWRMHDFVYPLPKPQISIFVQNAENVRYLPSFSKEYNRPFNLTVYLNTEDGPRPVHNPSIFDKKNYNSFARELSIKMPANDFYAELSPLVPLSEDEVVKFIENKLLGFYYEGSLSSVSVEVIEEIPGRVTLIIPTYKRPSNLKNALSSAINQNYDDKEIIVVSDNPADSEYVGETREIIEEARLKNPGVEIKLIQHKHNRNGAAARNTALLQSSGEYICFLDDDDICLPNRLSDTVEELKRHPLKVGAVYCGFLGWNSPKNDENRYRSGDLTKELLLLEYKTHYLHTNTATYRRSALLEIGGFDETYRRHQDIELNLRFFEKYVVEVVKKSGARLNPEPSSVSNKVFNLEMVELKQKFLSEFRSTIERFEIDVQEEIYRRHWEEVVRYVNDKDLVEKYLRSNYKNGALQVYISLFPSERPVVV